MEWLKLSVILFVICAVQCLTMSNDELEDFQNFLTKTSQLDQTIRKGVYPEDDDEEEAVSDHAWEESGKFEGDLILNDRQRRVIVQDVAEGLSRNGLRDSTKRWPNNEVIYYIQKDHFSSGQVEAIHNGIEDLAQASCIKFRPYKKGDRDAVVIQGSRRGCFSQVGYQSGYQVLNLSGRHPVGRGCFRHGTVVHELLHTLGFYHMQSSHDRDDFIDVIWENIRKQARHNFRKYNSFAVSDFGVGYDYDSVLHYSRRAFSTNGQDTLVPKKGGAEIGQRVGLSDKDTQKLNKMYCDADSDNNNADEDTISKPVKKKKPKNKPFDGHGIGYHQGKTVVIKLLPAPETYKLPDVPSFHVFDYFSKAPQALSTTSAIEGFGTGKEVIYPYHSPAANTEEYNKAHQITINSKGADQTIDDKTYVNTEEYKKPRLEVEHIKEDKWPNKDKITSDSDESNEKSSVFKQEKHTYDVPKESKESTLEAKKPAVASDTLDVDLSNAFDSLAKIIKSRVYPSQTPDLDIYRVRQDHIEVYNPNYGLDRKKDDETVQDYNEILKSGKEIIKEKYDRSILTSDTDHKKGNSKMGSIDSDEKHYHSDAGSHNPKKDPYDDYPYGSFLFPVRSSYKELDYVTAEYGSTDDDEHNDDYRALDSIKKNNKSKTGPNSLFDDLRYKWYGENKYTPTYSSSLANLRSTAHTPYTQHMKSQFHSKYDDDETYGTSSERHESHSVFGFPGALDGSKI